MRALTVLAAAALVVPVSGCGDDDDGRLSRAAFVEQADAICEEENDAVEEAGDQVFADEEPDAEAMTAFLDDIAIPRVESMIDRIDDLEPPEDMEADVGRLIAAAREALDAMRAAAESDDPFSLFAGEDPFAESDALALELGLVGCSDDDGEDVEEEE